MDFDPADPGSTGQVMQFRVVSATSPDTSLPPHLLQLPPLMPIGPETAPPRPVSLNEEEYIPPGMEGIPTAALLG